MNVLIRIFEPRECREVRQEAARIIKQHTDLAAGTLSDFCSQFIRRNRRAVRDVVRIEQIPVPRCAAFLVLNCIDKLVSSGQHHSYRGVLTAIGKDLLTAHTRLSGYLVESGFMNHEEAQQAREALRQEVAEVG